MLNGCFKQGDISCSCNVPFCSRIEFAFIFIIFLSCYVVLCFGDHFMHVLMLVTGISLAWLVIVHGLQGLDLLA